MSGGIGNKKELILEVFKNRRFILKHSVSQHLLMYAQTINNITEQ